MKPFDSNCFIYRDDCLLCERDDAQMRKSALTSDKHMVVVDSLSVMYEQENAKIMYRVKERCV